MENKKYLKYIWMVFSNRRCDGIYWRAVGFLVIENYFYYCIQEAAQ